MHCWDWKKVKEIPKGKMNKENLEIKIRVKLGLGKEAEGFCLQESRALGTDSSVRGPATAGYWTWDQCIKPESPKGLYPQRKKE